MFGWLFSRRREREDPRTLAERARLKREAHQGRPRAEAEMATQRPKLELEIEKERVRAMISGGETWHLP